MVRTRNVLKRGERIDQLIEEGRWQEGQSALGLPKVIVKRAVAGKKKKEKSEEGEGEEETTEET
jgi:small basic protein (TIGR04137 family)